MKKQSITTFEEAVGYLYDIPRFTHKHTLEDTRAYLHRLGDPDRKMHIIHVAGTNGKGSVCAYLRSVLEAAGKQVAVFTSPHLVDIRERFVLRGEMVSRERFLEAFLQIYESLDWGTPGFYHPTFFEYLFFMAMLLFSEEELDYCILETGLGGRLDATNAVSRKEISVITRISLDHQEHLGETVAEIAAEKAGIMQAGVPVVFLEEGEASAVLTVLAAELQSPIHMVSKRDYAFLNFKNKSIDFSLYTRYYDYIRVILRTIARYQMENAALAVRTLEVLDGGRSITAEAIVEGLGACVWAGRMEEILPEVYVDGAHNEDGIRAFLDTVGGDGREGRRLLLFGALSDKDYESMISLVAGSGLFDRVAVAPVHTPRTASVDRILEAFERYSSCDCSVYESADAALRALLSSRGAGERIYIAGSLYLIGEIKESFGHD